MADVIITRTHTLLKPATSSTVGLEQQRSGNGFSFVSLTFRLIAQGPTKASTKSRKERETRQELYTLRSWWNHAKVRRLQRHQRARKTSVLVVHLDVQVRKRQKGSTVQRLEQSVRGYRYRQAIWFGQRETKRHKLASVQTAGLTTCRQQVPDRNI